MIKAIELWTKNDATQHIVHVVTTSDRTCFSLCLKRNRIHHGPALQEPEFQHATSEYEPCTTMHRPVSLQAQCRHNASIYIRNPMETKSWSAFIPESPLWCAPSCPAMVESSTHTKDWSVDQSRVVHSLSVSTLCRPTAEIWRQWRQ
jgi:16S rRNA U1498 N3-methylase RsmE